MQGFCKTCTGVVCVFLSLSNTLSSSVIILAEKVMHKPNVNKLLEFDGEGTDKNILGTVGRGERDDWSETFLLQVSFHLHICLFPALANRLLKLSSFSCTFFIVSF